MIMSVHHWTYVECTLCHLVFHHFTGVLCFWNCHIRVWMGWLLLYSFLSFSASASHHMRFWKEGGCKNGKDCRHCHLCPEGEIRHRKKLKQERKDMALPFVQSVHIVRLTISHHLCKLCKRLQPAGEKWHLQRQLSSRFFFWVADWRE